MALRDQPYIPIYIQDVLTDEKLIECSAQAHGVYFRLLCILHKQEEYGKIKIKTKYKQNSNKTGAKEFAFMLEKQMPFTMEELNASIQELLEEGVVYLDGDYLCQKRMVKDGATSKARSKAGSKPKQKSNKRVNKGEASPENENENESGTVIDNESGTKEKKGFLDEILFEFQEAYKLTGSEYVIVNGPKERSALGKLLNIYKKKYPDANSEDTLAGLRAYFNTVVLIPDDWLRKNMSPSIIISKFNEINKILHEHNSGNNTKGTTDKELAELLFKHYGQEV